MSTDDDQNIYDGYSSKTCISCSPTLKFFKEYDPEDDVAFLYHSIYKRPLNFDPILRILAHRNFSQKEQIKLTFYKTFKKNLIEKYKSILHDKMEFIIMCLLYTGAELDAYILNELLTNPNRLKKATIQINHMIIHIICTRSHEVNIYVFQQLSQIDDSYRKLFHRFLREDITSIMLEDVRKFLIMLLDKKRLDNPPHIELATLQSNWIYSNKSSKNLPNDLNSIFANASYEYIISLTEIFQQKTGISLTEFLACYDGCYEYTIKTICQYAVNSIEYYATFLKTCIDDRNWQGIVCVLTTRAEIDLQCIFKAFYGLYSSKPEEKIIPIFKYKRLGIKTLLMLCGLK